MARHRAVLLLLLLAAPSRAQTPADSAATHAAVPDSTTSRPVPRATVQVVGTPVGVVRAGPGAQHPIVTTMHEGQTATFDARCGEWDHLELADGKSGWMHESCLRAYVDPRRFEFAPDPGAPPRQRSFHLSAYGGSYAADRENNAILYGVRMGYSLTSRFAFETAVGHTRIVRTTYILERLYNLRLEEERFDLFFYEAGMSMDVLPGRRITPFVAVGVGATVLNASVKSTMSLGIGTKMFVSKRLALRWELRDHHLHGGNQYTSFIGNNLEFSGGGELLF